MDTQKKKNWNVSTLVDKSIKFNKQFKIKMACLELNKKFEKKNKGSKRDAKIIIIINIRTIFLSRFTSLFLKSFIKLRLNFIERAIELRDFGQFRLSRKLSLHQFHELWRAN